jgi:hypothetical protein
MAKKTNTTRSNSAAAAGRGTAELCLMGPRQLSSHLRFVDELSLAGPAPAPSEAAHVWRQAADVYRRLEVAEAGAADNPQIRRLPAAMSAHQARLIALPAIRNTFSTVPVAFGMVELDKLIVSQYSITLANVARLRAMFSHDRKPADRQLAELCWPLSAGAAEFKLVGKDEQEFVFVSDAHDMRFLAAKVVRPEDIAGLAVLGHPQAVVALSVGMSANVVNAVRLGNRVVLNNGHHRAFALRAMGVTHMPCLIQVCGSPHELHEAATSEICDNSDLYFDSPRPPLLRDFDRPELTHRLSIPRLQRQVRVSFKVESRLLAV